MEEALRMIAEERRPCSECGKPHELRRYEHRWNEITWADPNDGHGYRQVSPEYLAAIVLSNTDC